MTQDQPVGCRFLLLTIDDTIEEIPCEYFPFPGTVEILRNTLSRLMHRAIQLLYEEAEDCNADLRKDLKRFAERIEDHQLHQNGMHGDTCEEAMHAIAKITAPIENGRNLDNTFNGYAVLKCYDAIAFVRISIAHFVHAKHLKAVRILCHA